MNTTGDGPRGGTQDGKAASGSLDHLPWQGHNCCIYREKQETTVCHSKEAATRALREEALPLPFTSSTLDADEEPAAISRHRSRVTSAMASQGWQHSKAGASPRHPPFCGGWASRHHDSDASENDASDENTNDEETPPARDLQAEYLAWAAAKKAIVEPVEQRRTRETVRERLELLSPLLASCHLSTGKSTSQPALPTAAQAAPIFAGKGEVTMPKAKRSGGRQRKHFREQRWKEKGVFPSKAGDLCLHAYDPRTGNTVEVSRTEFLHSKYCKHLLECRPSDSLPRVGAGDVWGGVFDCSRWERSAPLAHAPTASRGSG